MCIPRFRRVPRQPCARARVRSLAAFVRASAGVGRSVGLTNKTHSSALSLCHVRGIREQRQTGDVPRRANMARMYRRLRARSNSTPRLRGTRRRQDAREHAAANELTEDHRQCHVSIRMSALVSPAARNSPGFSGGREGGGRGNEATETTRNAHRNAPRRFDFQHREINTRTKRAAFAGGCAAIAATNPPPRRRRRGQSPNVTPAITPR